VTDVDVQAIGWQRRARFLGPFNGEHRASIDIVRQARVFEFVLGSKTIEVDVGEPETTTVFMDEDEGWAADASG
jgi:hypothetical protein